MTLKIAILLFDKFTALDVIGPYEVLAKLPDSKIYFIGKEKRDYQDAHGLNLRADHLLADISLVDVLLIPGGFGIDQVLADQAILEWVKKIDQTSTWTTSVCAGSLLLAAAGVLKGRKCTTHWGRKKQLKNYDVQVEDRRYVEDGKYLTSAGVSAGIDLALYLAGKIAGEQTAKVIQLAMEYAPQPPFDCGTPDKAPPEIMQKFIQAAKR